MSENPYIDGGGYLDDGPVKGSRTSVLAVASLATSLLCCIPFLGVISIVFGAASLILIGRSNGRLTGKGAAIAGLIVGIMTAVIWGAVSAGILQGWTFYTKQMIPVGESAMLAAQADDVDAMRAVLAPRADSELTDEQIELFMEACVLEMGTINGAIRDLGTIFESFVETYERSQGANQGGGGQFHDPVTPAPIGIDASNGKYMVWAIFDANTLQGGGTPKLADILVMRDGIDGFTLRIDGPGVDMGNAMSLHTSTAEKAIEMIRKDALEESGVEEEGEAAGGEDGEG